VRQFAGDVDAIAWAKRLDRYRPRLLQDTLGALGDLYGPQVWRRRTSPTISSSRCWPTPRNDRTRRTCS